MLCLPGARTGATGAEGSRRAIVGGSSMVPAGWTGRRVRLEYVAGGDPGGPLGAMGLGARSTSGKLLDVVGAGPVLGIEGARTLFPWSAVVLMELIED